MNRSHPTTGTAAEVTEKRAPAPDSGTDSACGTSEARHIIDVLIEERAPRLRQWPRLWSVLRKVVLPVFRYREAVAMADAIAQRSGAEAFTHICNTLELSLTVKGLESVPETGGAIVMANHPTGIADGAVLFDVLNKVRSDMTIFANRDAIRVCPGFADIMIPVEWRTTERSLADSRETLRAAATAFKSGRLVVIFPSGRLAQMTRKGLVERPWLPTAVQWARRYDLPVIPLHITGRNSWLYYLLWYINTELKDMTLFREVLNKHRQKYALQFGQPVAPELLRGDARQVTQDLQGYVERQLPAGKLRYTGPDARAMEALLQPVGQASL